MCKMAARIRCIIPVCTCHRRLGRLQGEFEIRIKNGELPSDICRDLGCTLICCRSNMIYPPTFPLGDSNAGCFIDEVGVVEKTSHVRGKALVKDGPDLFLEDIPDFPVFN